MSPPFTIGQILTLDAAEGSVSSVQGDLPSPTISGFSVTNNSEQFLSSSSVIYSSNKYQAALTITNCCPAGGNIASLNVADDTLVYRINSLSLNLVDLTEVTLAELIDIFLADNIAAQPHESDDWTLSTTASEIFSDIEYGNEGVTPITQGESAILAGPLIPINVPAGFIGDNRIIPRQPRIPSLGRI
jgi:hypothetical protein